MKIYRFVPQTLGYASIPKTVAGRWWPDGIEMGRAMNRIFPKTSPAAHENNVYHRYPAHLQLTDFPAFALNLPIVSERAAGVLQSAGLANELVPLTVSDVPYFAVQPTKQPEAFLAESSEGLTLPGGDVFHYYRRNFDPAKVNGEFFPLAVLGPYSDLYVTERLVSVAREAGLTGLDSVELVYDDGPLTVRYPPSKRPQISQIGARRSLEWELLYWRCFLWNHDDAIIRNVIERAAVDCWISLEATTQA